MNESGYVTNKEIGALKMSPSGSILLWAERMMADGSNQG
jgi:hypothetical protein